MAKITFTPDDCETIKNDMSKIIFLLDEISALVNNIEKTAMPIGYDIPLKRGR